MRNERKEIEMKERHSGEGREREREREREVCRGKGGRGGWCWKIDRPIEKEIQRSEGESEMDVAYKAGEIKRKRT